MCKEMKRSVASSVAMTSVVPSPRSEIITRTTEPATTTVTVCDVLADSQFEKRRKRNEDSDAKCEQRRPKCFDECHCIVPTRIPNPVPLSQESTMPLCSDSEACESLPFSSPKSDLDPSASAAT